MTLTDYTAALKAEGFTEGQIMAAIFDSSTPLIKAGISEDDIFDLHDQMADAGIKESSVARNKRTWQIIAELQAAA